MTVNIRVSLEDVEVEIEEDEVLEEMSTEDIIDYLKDHGDDGDIIMHLCESMGNVEVAKKALNGVDDLGITELFNDMGWEKPQPNWDISLTPHLNNLLLTIDRNGKQVGYVLGNLVFYGRCAPETYRRYEAPDREAAFELAHLLARSGA